MCTELSTLLSYCLLSSLFSNKYTISMNVLGFNSHGKGRVRLVKVIRNKTTQTHDVIQFNVQILLEGDNMKEVFLNGDNSPVVATDTCKNTVYCLANQHDFKSPEEFGIIICKHFLTQYATIVNRISVEIIQDRWERLSAPDSKGKMGPHKHTFRRIGPNRPYANVQGEKRPRSELILHVQAGFTNLDILKTTQSGFVGFHRDQYTSLPEVEDRLLGTSIDAEWSYPSHLIDKMKFDYEKISSTIQNALIYKFAGPSDKGTYSKSVQQTLYEMADSTLKSVNEIDSVCIVCCILIKYINDCNIHNIFICILYNNRFINN